MSRARHRVPRLDTTTMTHKREKNNKMDLTKLKYFAL